MSEVLTGKQFKAQLREGRPKMGLFVNSHSPTVAEQLAHSGYDWLLVDTQHGPDGQRNAFGNAGWNSNLAARCPWCASADTPIARAFSKLSIWAPTASSALTSTRLTT